MWTVYIHTNKESGKVYIGITGQPVERRWLPDGSGYKKYLLFYRAIQKCGWDSFKHEILHEVKTKFASTASASRETGINKCMIGQSCRSNGNKIVSGYRWQFVKEVGA